LPFVVLNILIRSIFSGYTQAHSLFESPQSGCARAVTKAMAVIFLREQKHRKIFLYCVLLTIAATPVSHAAVITWAV
jgi:hypothetical protein